MSAESILLSSCCNKKQRIIAYDLVIDKARKEGAITELKKELTNLNIELKKYERKIRIADLCIKQYVKGLRDKTLGLIADYEKRLKLLGGN